MSSLLNFVVWAIVTTALVVNLVRQRRRKREGSDA